MYTYTYVYVYIYLYMYTCIHTYLHTHTKQEMFETADGRNFCSSLHVLSVEQYFQTDPTTALYKQPRTLVTRRQIENGPDAVLLHCEVSVTHAIDDDREGFFIAQHPVARCYGATKDRPHRLLTYI